MRITAGSVNWIDNSLQESELELEWSTENWTRPIR